MPRLAYAALAVCLLSLAAAVLSFVDGNWIGVLWIFVAGLSSNMLWFYRSRARRQQQRA